MQRIMRALAMAGLVTTAVPATTVAADAPSIAKVVKDWGLLGTWAIDCKAPPSRANVFSTYVVRHGRVFLERTFGDPAADSSEIVAILMVAGDLLEFTVDVRTLNQIRTIAVQRDTPTSIHTAWNHDDGRYSVRSGRIMADGSLTPRQKRCR